MHALAMRLSSLGTWEVAPRSMRQLESLHSLKPTRPNETGENFWPQSRPDESWPGSSRCRKARTCAGRAGGFGICHSVAPFILASRLPARPKLDPFVGIIDQILEEDGKRPGKQRHTSKRILFNLGAAWCGEFPLVVSPGREHLPSIGQSDPPIVVKRAETLLPSDAAAAATAMTMPAAITPYSMAVTPLRSAVACA